MLDKISRKILVIISNDEQTETEKEVLLFGITRIVEDIPKTLGIILIGLILNILKEIIIITAVIAVYKTFLGGVHAKTNLGCFLYSVFFYLITIYSSKYLYFNNNNQWGIFIFIYIFAIYTILVYAPADVPEIPKVNKKLRNTLKLKSFLSLNLIYIICTFLITDLSLKILVIYSVFYISLMTTRSIYKLFKNQYGHECYVPDELI